MNIRTKVISLLAMLFVILIALEIVVQHVIVMPSFAELERDDAKVSMKRIDYALDVSLDNLALSAADWGNWGDVYHYVQAPNPEFVRVNLTPTALKQLQVDVLMIADLAGKVVLSDARDSSGGSGPSLDFSTLRDLPADFPWRADIAAGKSAKGLIRTNLGLMMIAAAPVLDGSGGGRALGAVIMGRLMTPERVRMLAARAQADLIVGPPDHPIAGRELSETESTTRIERQLSDIYGRPLASLEVDVPRRITARGHNAVSYASMYLIGAAVAVLVLVVMILNRVVLEPLARVTRHAVSIGEGDDLSARLDLDSGDEIGLLAREFDSMVARVEETRNELIDNSFQAGFAELAKGVLHNLGNAMTPMTVRLVKLRDRLKDLPTADLQRASSELKEVAQGSPRQADLIEFLRLGSQEAASAVAESKADLEIVQRQTQIVQTALSELMRSTRTEPAIETVRLPDLVNQTLEIVPDACRRRLIVDTDESLGRVGAVRIARTVLRLVLQNLIINAADAVRDAGRDKGVLKVAAEIVRENDSEQLHLHCKDDGVGIAEGDLKRVFDKGYSTKSRDTNSGIGLHWCANSIAALGGRIWAASEGPGLGASLHLMLPLAALRNSRMDP
ncbi:MAG TPA: CHASE4 domain-containing protein [Steroidobacteraceae bacterium]|jgi:sensor domain CHASE-containing protein|nr:CHASE4 domain-containing protein [Steroidobacteraceae bacterium]